MATFKWLPYNTPDAVFTTQLNTLAISGYAYSVEVDNTAGLYLYGDLTIVLSAAVTTVSPAFISVFVLPNIDTHYSATAGNPGASFLAGTFTGPGGSLQYAQVRGLIIPPAKFTLVVQNNLGVALPASGNTANLYRYGEQAV